MKDLPIIFNAHSVHAILAGIKTQTRRVLNPQPVCHCDEFERPFERHELMGPEWYAPAIWDTNGELDAGPEIFGIYDTCGESGWSCPYVPGRKLWVREAWAVDQQRNGQRPSELPDDLEVWYRAGGSRYDVPNSYWQRGKWRSPIFMPRWASRLTLEVTAVKLERLQDITEADAIAEGIDQWSYGRGGNNWGGGPNCETTRDPVTAFSWVWDAINGHKHPWASNPWVFAVTFERIDT